MFGAWCSPSTAALAPNPRPTKPSNRPHEPWVAIVGLGHGLGIADRVPAMPGVRHFRAKVACSIVVGILGVHRAAFAAPSARLVYVRDPEAASCPDETAVRSAVAARLGYDPFLAYATATMFAEVRRDRTTYKVAIKLIDEHSIVRGARELVHVGEPCSELIDLMALSMSIAIDPLSLAGPRPPPDAPVVADPVLPPKSPPEPPPTIPPAGPPAAPKKPADEPKGAPVHFDLGIGPSFGIGTAPSPTVGALVGGYWHIGRLGLFGEGRADLPSSRIHPQGTVGTSLIAGSLGLCYELRIVFGCALGSLGALSASAEGISAPRSDVAVHASVGARFGAELRLAPAFALRAQLDGAAVLTPHRLTIDGSEVQTLSPIAGTLGILAAVRFF